MSEDDLDVIRRWFDAWNSGDMDTFANLFDADAEVIADPSFPEAGPFRGRQAIGNFFEGVKESWEGQDQAVLTELFEVGDNVVGRWLNRSEDPGGSFY